MSEMCNYHEHACGDYGPPRKVRGRSFIYNKYEEMYRCRICGNWRMLDVRINKDWRYRTQTKCCDLCEQFD